MFIDIIRKNYSKKGNNQYVYTHSRLKKPMLIIMGLAYLIIKSCNCEISKTYQNNIDSIRKLQYDPLKIGVESD